MKKKGLIKIKQDRKQAAEVKKSISGTAVEKPLQDGADVPGSLSMDQVFDLAGGGRSGNPKPPH